MWTFLQHKNAAYLRMMINLVSLHVWVQKNLLFTSQTQPIHLGLSGMGFITIFAISSYWWCDLQLHTNKGAVSKSQTFFHKIQYLQIITFTAINTISLKIVLKWIISFWMMIQMVFNPFTPRHRLWLDFMWLWLIWIKLLCVNFPMQAVNVIFRAI